MWLLFDGQNEAVFRPTSYLLLQVPKWFPEGGEDLVSFWIFLAASSNIHLDMWEKLRRMLFRPPQTLLGFAWMAKWGSGSAHKFLLWERMRKGNGEGQSEEKTLKLWHFMGCTASRRLLTVCWTASLAVFALDTTSHWVLVGTVSHVPPCSGKHGFIAVVLRSWQGRRPLGDMGRWHKAGGVEAFPSKRGRKVFLKCFFPFRHPSLVLGRALLWPRKRDVLEFWCACVVVDTELLFLCLLHKFYPHLEVP